MREQKSLPEQEREHEQEREQSVVAGLGQNLKAPTAEKEEGEKLLLLKDEGLEAIRTMFECESNEELEGSHQWCVAMALNKTRATRVGDLEISVSLENFALATGLQAEGGAGLLGLNAHCRAQRPMDHENLVKHFEHAPAVKPQNGYMLDKCRDPVLRDIVILLNMTFWMKLIRQSRCSGELLYLVVQAMEGLEVNWSRVFYEKFVCEVMRLQDVLSNKHIVSHQQLITVAGPLMCFLYDCAKVNRTLAAHATDARHFAQPQQQVQPEEQLPEASEVQQSEAQAEAQAQAEHNSIDEKYLSCTKRSYEDCVLQQDSTVTSNGTSVPLAEMPTKVQKVESTRASSTSMELVYASEQSRAGEEGSAGQREEEGEAA
ncbi:hypothetical protein AXG93_673s1230 [Marchantia polymorpha subsp. ruderalis]|uniref:Uncharacterized protein n=1 Tax=Marchantia polymorpha subsp. ruderalis TaxID=1480154 RepID=A0A176WL37_MARPO|nr:hypothetical protein AXG93_673s1230 [Marchantia polymorpha subsp. ruderalis]